MKCPSCGNDVLPGARFCANCGTALQTQEAGEPASWEPPDPSPGQLGTEPGASDWGGPPTPRDPAAHVGADTWAQVGAPDDAGAHEPPPPMPPQISGERRPGAAWAKAFGLGALSFLVVLLLALVTAFVAFFQGDADIVDVAKFGGMLFYGFHHVGIQADLPTFDVGAFIPEGAEAGIPPIGPIDLTYTVAVALLLGTLLGAFLLYRAGRRVAEEGGGTPLVRILQGATVALPYAALSLLLSFAITFELSIPTDTLQESLLPAGGAFTLSVSPLAAFLWPLVIAALAGGAGGFSAARPDLHLTGPKLAAAMGGGTRMLLYALLAGFVALLVLAGTSPDATAGYFEAVTSGGRSGLGLLLFTVLGAPNLALWGLAIGMGTGIGVSDAVGASQVTLASLFRFPESVSPEVLGGAALGGAGLEQAPFQFGTAPLGYFAFTLAALVAVVLGGRSAARRAEAATAGEGAGVGAGAGLVFGLWMVLAMLLAGFAVKMGFAGDAPGAPGAELARFGPSLVLGGLAAVAWGVLGGALGGATGTGGPVAPAVRRPPGRETSSFATPAGAASPVPGGGGTGFEGLASPAWAQPEPEPEPEPEPQAEPQPEPEPEAPAELASEAAPEAEPQQPSPFEFTTPATQYGQPEEQQPSPGAEPPLASPEPEPEPPTWTPPAPTPAAEPEPPAEPPAWTPFPATPDPEQERGAEEAGPAETPAPETPAPEAPVWAPAEPYAPPVEPESPWTTPPPEPGSGTTQEPQAGEEPEEATPPAPWTIPTPSQEPELPEGEPRPWTIPSPAPESEPEAEPDDDGDEGDRPAQP